MKDYRLFGLFWTIAVAFACYIIISKLIPEDKTTINYISIIGTGLSLAAIGFSFFEIRSINETNKQVSASIEKSIQRMLKNWRIADVSRAIQLIVEIQTYVSNSHYMLAFIRLKDLKHIIIGIRLYPDLIEVFPTANFDAYFARLILDINNVDHHNQGVGKSKINNLTLNRNLEEMSTHLSELEQHLKTVSHGH